MPFMSVPTTRVVLPCCAPGVPNRRGHRFPIRNIPSTVPFRRCRKQSTAFGLDVVGQFAGRLRKDRQRLQFIEGRGVDMVKHRHGHFFGHAPRRSNSAPNSPWLKPKVCSSNLLKAMPECLQPSINVIYLVCSASARISLPRSYNRAAAIPLRETQAPCWDPSELARRISTR